MAPVAPIVPVPPVPGVVPEAPEHLQGDALIAYHREAYLESLANANMIGTKGSLAMPGRIVPFKILHDSSVAVFVMAFQVASLLACRIHGQFH